MNTKNTNSFIPQIILLSLLLLFGITSISAQKLNIRVYGVQDGLSQSEVNTINQDSQQRLWLGTSSGLSIFNGKNFKTIKKEDGLGGNFITASWQDDHNNLWLGHYSPVVSKINMIEQSIETFPLPVDSNKSNSIYLYRILPDKNGNLWFITYSNGVFVLKKNERTIKKRMDFEVYDACIDKNNLFWFTNDKNVYSFDLNSGKMDSLNLKGVIEPGRILTLFCDDQNIIWMGANRNELLYFDGSKSTGKRPVKLLLKDKKTKFNIINITEDKDHLFWMNTYYGGVIKFDPDSRNKRRPDFTRINTRNGLSIDNTLTTFIDLEGNYWFGTSGGGLCKYRDDSFMLYNKNDGLTDNLVWKIIKDRNGAMWIAGDAGLNKLSNPNAENETPDIKKFEKVNKENLIAVIVIYEDQDGYIWGGYLEKIFRLDPRTEQFTFYDIDASKHIIVSAINEDKTGRLLFGTLENGIYGFDKKNNLFYKFNKPGISDHCSSFFYKDNENNIWIGGEGSDLCIFDGGNIKKISTPIASLMDIVEDRNGHLWIISGDHDLYYYDKNKFELINIPTHQSNETLYSVETDDLGNIWLGKTFGLLKLNPQNMEISQYGKLDGFSIQESNQGASFKDEKGNLWFGTTGGLVKASPGEIKKNTIPPFCKITGLDLFNQPVKMAPNQEFRFDENYISFHFLGISLTSPEKVSYSYQLEGFGKGWSPPLREDHIAFANLSPGDYKLMVRAINEEGIFSVKPAVFHFFIAAPFWQTTWFYILMFLIFGVATFSIHKKRMSRIEKQNVLLETKIEARTSELSLEKEKAESSALALRESELKFRNLTEMTSVAIFIYAGADFRYVNPAMEQITGYSRKELLKMNFWEVVHPDYRELIKSRGMKRQAGENLPNRYQFKIVQKSGEDRWVDFIAQKISFEGAPAALGTATDITALKKIETELMSQKEKLSVTLKSIGDGVITTDINGKITLLNQAAEKLTGWLHTQALNKDISEVFSIIHSQSKKPLENPVTSFIRNQDYSNFETQAILITKSGDETIIAGNGAPITSNINEIIGYAIVFRDISENIRLQEELLKVQKLDSVGVLAGGLAHDFNNILTAITGNISLAELHAGNDIKLLELLKEAEKASTRARDITQQLLTFSKGGSPVKVTASIKEIISESINFTLRGSKVSSKFIFPEKLWHVNVDSGQISQVIQNLGLNSMQAMPDGGIIQVNVKNVEFKKETRPSMAQGKYVEIKFKDEGQGIAKNIRDKIFDPYFSTKEKGMGLGLASVYSIIKNHGGSIDVHSKPGSGTTFIIYLPAADDLKETQKSIETDKMPDIAQSGKILLMDDDHIVLRVANRMLIQLGYSVILATHGEEVIAKYKEAIASKDNFDAVILDLTIPGKMGGKVTMEKLLEIDPETCGIVTSGYSNDDVLANFSQYGFKARIQKPFNLDELKKTLLQSIH